MTLPLVPMRKLVEEANNLPVEPYERDYVPRDVVVLVIDRASIEFQDEDASCLDYERIRIKPNPHILAVASTDGVRNSYRILAHFPQRIQQKALLAFRLLIGSFGIYPFKRIWALTVPESWRGEDGIDQTIGNVR
jgi:hypothetical protein